MSLKKIERELIYKFVLENVKNHPNDIALITAGTFRISRQAVNNYLKKCINDGLLTAEGVKRGAQYRLKETQHKFDISVTPDLREDEVWREKILPVLPALNENILGICNYGFTEMLNNVIDHSESDIAKIVVNFNAIEVAFIITDYGIGIFNKIRQALKLSDPKHAILELAKGKVTTDPDKHTGEGIFFTSRMFDGFDILSGNLYFHGHKGDDWLLDKEMINRGTAVFMKINRESKRTTDEIFSEYTPAKDDYGFTRTKIPVKLLKYEGEELVSRSQAKRLTARFDKFKEIILDFDGVKRIGQAFADEIFRVFQAEHPDIHILWVNENEDVGRMIKHAQSNK